MSELKESCVESAIAVLFLFSHVAKFLRNDMPVAAYSSTGKWYTTRFALGTPSDFPISRAVS